MVCASSNHVKACHDYVEPRQTTSKHVKTKSNRVKQRQTTLYRSGDMLLRRIERLTMEALSVRFDAAAPARALDNIIAVQSER